VARCFWLGRGDRNAGWADRSGGAEFRLPLLIGVFGFAALQAVIPNKAMSLIVVLTALPARSFAIPFLEVIAHWTIAVNLLAGSLIGAWLGARSTGAPSQLSYIDAGLVDLVVPMCCIALIMVAARRIRIFLHSSSCPVSWRRPGRGSGPLARRRTRRWVGWALRMAGHGAGTPRCRSSGAGGRSWVLQRGVLSRRVRRVPGRSAGVGVAAIAAAMAASMGLVASPSRGVVAWHRSTPRGAGVIVISRRRTGLQSRHSSIGCAIALGQSGLACVVLGNVLDLTLCSAGSSTQ
jgi:hypothetical protein